MTTSGKKRIFISYRRADSAGYAGRIYDRLTAHFGVDAVFMDVDTIEAGLDFVEVLQNAVQSCDVLVALIGRRWLNSKDAVGNRRLDNPEDFVRIEISAALERDIRVIPVLVDGVGMPYSSELPENLKPLARRNALQVDHHSFNGDTRRLISQLELALKAAEDSRILKAQILRGEKERKEKEPAEKAAREKAEREAEEKARIEKETLEKAEAEERARLAAQQAQIENEELKRKAEAEKVVAAGRLPSKEDSSKIYSEGARKKEKSIQGKSYRESKKLLLYLGSIFIILLLLGYIIKNPPTPSTPPPLTETPDVIGIGSTTVSEKDGMVMVYIPKGEFQMGSKQYDDEKPIHIVDLDAFWIDQTEVTNAMYAKCVEAGECDPPIETKSNTRDSYYGNSEFDDYPVIYVSWNDAAAYCEWADRRLPAEAEWEKAAGWDNDVHSQRVYPWGDMIDGSYANYNQEVGDTTIVGSYEKGVSFYGAYDMAGNVFEWVGGHVLRGGSWDDGDFTVRSTYRVWYGGGAGTYDTIGFRCARSAQTTTTDAAAAYSAEELGVGATMTSEKDGMVMVYVSAGEFQMGSEQYDDEKPIHIMDLDAFWIDQTEVTNAMYAKCVEAGKCDLPNSTKSNTRDSYYGNSEFNDYPVIYVYWNNAVAYCEWAGRRLPTEAEWEKAARGNDNQIYPWGNTINCSFANYQGDRGYCVGDTTEVGEYENGKNSYGIYDMAGNVWEWVADWYDVYPGGDENASQYFGQTLRTLRSGSWSSSGDLVRSANRHRLLPPTGTGDNIGFRCARDAE